MVVPIHDRTVGNQNVEVVRLGLLIRLPERRAGRQPVIRIEEEDEFALRRREPRIARDAFTTRSCLLPAFCLWKTLVKRTSLIREIRNAETKENSLRRLNNSNVVIKHSQGPLVLSQGL